MTKSDHIAKFGSIPKNPDERLLYLLAFISRRYPMVKMEKHGNHWQVFTGKLTCRSPSLLEALEKQYDGCDDL